MKNIIFLSILLITISCEKKLPLFYHGVVVDEYNKPIDSVIIKEMPYIYVQSTISIKNGQFKLYKDPNSRAPLIFSKKGYIIDTVSIIISPNGGYFEYRFLNEIMTINDTLVLKKVK